MAENVLYQYKEIIQLANVEEQLFNVFVEDKIYSYLLYLRCDERGMMKDYLLRITIAQESEFNTIDKNFAINSILDNIEMYKEYIGETKIIGFKQPSIELMLKLYEPYMFKLAEDMQNYWPQYEIEDLLQICRISMFNLYNKGYYVHKNLLKITFKREVLMEVRTMKHSPSLNGIVVTSLYDRYESGDSDDKHLYIADCMPDKVDLEKQQDDAIVEGNMKIFEEVKGIIIDLVGPRQFDMLFRDYSRGHTTPSSRKLLQKIKTHLKSMGITLNQFNNKYH